MTERLDWRVRELFDSAYLPLRMEDPTDEHVANFYRAINYWEKLTLNLALRELDGNHRAMGDFRAALAKATYCRRHTGQPACGCDRARPLDKNTQAAWMKHVQWILTFAGPPHPPYYLNAQRIIAEVPYAKPPKKRRKHRPPAPLGELQRLFASAHLFRHPQVDWATPAQIWRAFFGLMMCTALRKGQCWKLPWSAVDLARRLIILPESLCRKSKNEEPHPLSIEAVELLLPLRGQRALVFPFLACCSSTIYDDLRRVQKAIGVTNRWQFHAVRRTSITALSRLSPALAQLQAGHEAYTTTMLYQGVEELGEVVNQLPSLRVSG